MSETTITILGARLLLVHLPRELLQSLMFNVLDCWWHRPKDDPFFSLCENGLEVSLFADAATVRRSFSSFLTNSEPSTSASSIATSPQPTPPPLLSPAPGDSGFTISPDQTHNDDVVTSPTDFRHPFDAELDAERASQRRRDRKGKGKERRTYTQVEGEDKVKVGDEVWTALEIEFHGDGWEEAASRVHSISSPLAEQGISILFLSTYQSDYILVPSSHLSSVTATLEKSGFRFNLDDNDSDDESVSTGGRDRRGSVGPMSPISETDKMRRSFSYTSTTSARRDQSTASRHSSTGGSLSNSLVLSEHSVASSGAVSVLSRSESAARAHPPLPIDPPAPEDADFNLPPGSLSLLSDELVCVGLSAEREAGWREKIIQALFFPDRVLADLAVAGESSPGTPAALTPSIKSISLSRSNSGTSGSLSRDYRKARSKSRARSKSHLLRDALGESQQATPKTGNSRTRGAGSAGSSPPSRQASLVPALPAKPTPFIALTSVVGQTSLTADVKLLRALFTPAEEEDMVFSIGNGGLAGVWQGEEEEDDLDDGCAQGDGEEEEGGSSKTGRGRGRGRPANVLGLYGTEASEEDESEGDDDDDWEKVEECRERRREMKRKREMAKEAGEGGRRLLKCLQLDLTGFALDKHGIVEYYAGLLIKGGVNLLYQSTYQSANILVSKQQSRLAKRILEESWREGGLEGASAVDKEEGGGVGEGAKEGSAA